MNSKILKPFLSATVHVIETTTQIKVIPGVPSIKSGRKTWGDITGLIGMVSNEIKGNMIVSFEEKSILAIVSKMIFEEKTELDSEVIDAVGEITNMIVGNAKREFSEKGMVFSMARPIVLAGRSIELTQITEEPTISIPFSTAMGDFVVEFNLS